MNTWVFLCGYTVYAYRVHICEQISVQSFLPALNAHSSATRKCWAMLKVAKEPLTCRLFFKKKKEKPCCTFVQRNPVRWLCTLFDTLCKAVLSKKKCLPKEMSAAATGNPLVPIEDCKNDRKKPKRTRNFCWSKKSFILNGMKSTSFVVILLPLTLFNSSWLPSIKKKIHFLAL